MTIIGSKKWPIFPINLLPVVGILIRKILFILVAFGIKSFLSNLKFLGKKKNNTIIDVISLIIFDSTIKATAYSIPLVRKIGIPIIIIISLIISSVTFDTTCGIIFCLPKKYPLKIDEILINGRTKPVQIRA